MSDHPVIRWKEKGEIRSARWRSERGVPPPKRVVVADDSMKADQAYQLACEGTGLLWRGDFQNARQLLQALARRVDRNAPKAGTSPAETFHLYRQAQSQRARVLGMLLLPFDADHTVPLRRAPAVREACAEAYGSADERYVASLRELLGIIGAHEWRKHGIEIPTLGQRIHPHYGV
ncbi:MAG: methyltransferase, partial [Betaproteobacteria bacterium]|nr:methyltransferase [Betaproteobacteria bacterium]